MPVVFVFRRVLLDTNVDDLLQRVRTEHQSMESVRLKLSVCKPYLSNLPASFIV